MMSDTAAAEAIATAIEAHLSAIGEHLADGVRARATLYAGRVLNDNSNDRDSDKLIGRYVAEELFKVADLLDLAANAYREIIVADLREKLDLA